MNLPVFEAMCLAGYKPPNVFAFTVSEIPDRIPETVPCTPPFREGFAEIVSARMAFLWKMKGNRICVSEIGFTPGSTVLSTHGIHWELDLDPDTGWVIPESLEIHPTHDGALEAIAALPPEVWTEFQVKLGGDTRALLYMFALCHVKNITVRDAPLPRAMRRRLKAKLADLDLVRVKTLNIIPFGAKKNQPKCAPGDGYTPCHLVRGHFATYTDAAPLFGKYTGPFWIAEHERGNKAFGTIEHRYNVKPFDDVEVA